jgi:hypothetical protein
LHGPEDPKNNFEAAVTMSSKEKGQESWWERAHIICETPASVKCEKYM